MQAKLSWWFVPLLVALVVGMMLVGFRANPAPQPQRVADLVARIETLEGESRSHKAALDALIKRVDTLEGLGIESDALVFDQDIVIPRGWAQSDSGDGVVRYWHDPVWELSSDEPGTLDFWLDEDTSLFFEWDWSADLLDQLHGDERYFGLFEEDLVWSDETIQMEIERSGALEFMDGDAHYWDIHMQSTSGFFSRMLIIFYPCSELVSCNVTLMHFTDDPGADEVVEGFTREEWSFVNTFANGVEFLNEGQASMTASANLRRCPATNCEIVGRLVRGEIVEVVAISDDGEWYQLESGDWVAADLVRGAPSDLPVVRDADNI